MLIEDGDLPAAAHLTSAGAIDVLRPPVEAAGGVLIDARPCHVQFRPGADLIVRYSTDVSWNGAPAARETLVAATTIAGPHEGAAQVTTGTGSSAMTVGVWKWPFDPVLIGLHRAVTPESVAAILGVDRTSVRLEVVAFRPTERAVVRATVGRREWYLKVVGPGMVDALVARHALLREAGVAVARVVDVRPCDGIVVFEALSGRTLRESVKAGKGTWPGAAEFDRLAAQFADVEVPDAKPLASRITDGKLHAAMLATVLPAERDRLARLTEAFSVGGSNEPDGTIHGDLHEGQLVVANGRIVGVFDIDDAGPGSSIDDRASLLAHLTYRAVSTPTHRARITRYVDDLRQASASTFDPDALDRTTAAVLVGLATGPFRIQQSGWHTKSSEILAAAERVLNCAPCASTLDNHQEE